MKEKKLLKALENCKHPNSRRTKAIAKKIQLNKSREKVKLGFAERANVVGKTLSFFADKTEGRTNPLTPEEFEEFINEYFHRFDEELEQIRLKSSINKKRSNQHASRESVIKMTLEKDIKNFNAGGMELPNLCDPIDYQKFIDWDGDSHKIQHMKLTFISKSFLNKLKVAENSDIAGTSKPETETLEKMES